MPVLRRLLVQITHRQDLAIVLLLIISLTLMILPLPTLLVDLALASNMAFAVLLLMVSIYLRNPLEFSLLPSVILISTVFRLSLSIATTRLILLQADAGHIVETFGRFVVAGNLIVGLVIFLIITIVQFVVITKGSERVAEVSARFTLDALPGKQMSIDAELRAGEIDQEEARRRRQHLEKESQLYGAMDGAMKFVKGDAIAGLIIIAVNLLGGLAVGTLQRDLPLGEALHVYSVLTIGDGLVAQIPALLVSLTAGMVVTRVTTDDSRDLGSDIVSQLLFEPRAAMVAAAVLVGLAMVPGFPAAVFLVLAMILGGIGFAQHLRRRKIAAIDADGAAATETGVLPAIDGDGGDAERIILAIGSDFESVLDPALLIDQIRLVPERLERDLGVRFPAIRVCHDPLLTAGAFRIDLEGVPILEEPLPSGRVCVAETEAHLALLEIKGEPGPRLSRSGPTFWVDASHIAAVDEAGFPWFGAEQILVERIGETLKRNASRFVGLEETQRILAEAERSHRDLVREVQKSLSLQKFTEIFRRLVDDGVSLKSHRLLLEALLDLVQREQDVAMLAEYVRTAVARQICHAHADEHKVISAFLMERSLEDLLRQSIKHTSMGSHLALPDRTRRRLLDLIRLHWKRSQSAAVEPVVLTSLDIRRYVRQLLIRNDLYVPVLAHSEVARDFTVQPVTTLRLSNPTPAEVAAGGAPAHAMQAA